MVGAKKPLRRRMIDAYNKTLERARRDPKNRKEYAVRVRLHRIELILMNRYDYIPWAR